MGFIIRAGAEVEVSRDSGDSAVGADCQAPQSIDRYRTVAGTLQQTFEMAVSIEGHDGAAAEVADEQLVRMRAEGAGRDRQSPGRVHLANISASSFARGEAMESPGADIEGVDQAASAAGNIVRPGGILFGEGNEGHAVQVL